MTALDRLQRDYPDFLEGCVKLPSEEVCEVVLSGLEAWEAITERARERARRRNEAEQKVA